MVSLSISNWLKHHWTIRDQSSPLHFLKLSASVTFLSTLKVSQFQYLETIKGKWEDLLLLETVLWCLIYTSVPALWWMANIFQMKMMTIQMVVWTRVISNRPAKCNIYLINRRTTESMVVTVAWWYNPKWKWIITARLMYGNQHKEPDLQFVEAWIVINPVSRLSKALHHLPQVDLALQSVPSSVSQV